MTNLTGAPSWDSVPQIDTTTQLLGGLGGPLNQPHQALLNRTEWLKAQQKTAAVTLYVRTDGSDLNDGSLNDAQHALATIQRAFDIALTYQVTGASVKVKLGNSGSFAGGKVMGTMAGNWRNLDGAIYLEGDTANPGNTIVTGVVRAGFGGYVQPQYLTLAVPNDDAIAAAEGGVMDVGPGLIFGVCSGSHIAAYEHGIAYYYNNVTISGGAYAHLYAWGRGYIEGGWGQTHTLLNTPAFSNAFVTSADGSHVLLAGGITWNGNASGPALNIDPLSQFKGREWNGALPGGLTAQQVQGIVGSAFIPSAPVAVAGLVTPGVAIRGARCLVTDSTVAAAGNFGAAVVGGGANVVPVWCDGATWRIG